MVDDVENVVQQLVDRVSSSYDFLIQKIEDDVKEIVRELLDHTSFWDEPSKLELDFFSLDYRKAPSLASASSFDDNELGDPSDNELPFLASDGDSEKEFDKLQRFTYETRNKIFKREHSEGIPLEKKPKADFQLDTSDLYHEYDNLPPLEGLTIHCEEEIPLELVGHVTSIVDCLVVVQSDNGVALDFDSVLFDKDRKCIGVVFDLFGPVKNPLYSIRFNTKEEASKMSVGMQVYYAPNTEKYTKTVIDTVKKEIASDEDDLSDIDAKFSDDEKEKEYKARKMATTSCSGTFGMVVQKRNVRFSDSTVHKGRGGKSDTRAGIGGRSWNWHSNANRAERCSINCSLLVFSK